MFVFTCSHRSPTQGEWKKYSEYAVEVDPDQDDKATQIKMCSFARPHMRAFHCSWFAFFNAFIIWFCVAPLLPEIKKTLKISKQDIWTSNIVAVGGTIFMRFILGPLCDKYGARIPFAWILCLAAIPTAAVGLVNNKNDLIIVRLFIGIAGGTFVMCQYWSSRMFARDVVGTANAITAGWGNLGGGVTHLLTGSILFPLFKVFYDGDHEKAWRTCTIVPAFVAFVTGVVIYHISDDCPKGNYQDLKRNGTMPEVSAAYSFRAGSTNLNSWIMFFQYAGCFGVEITFNNAAAVYFHDQFGVSTEKAAAIASVFGWLNIFSRGTGGFISDQCNARWGMRGRIWFQTILLLCEAVMVLIFAETHELGASIFVLAVFSLFVQMCTGSSFGIVPYIDPPSTGSISGIVGAGGNVGAVGFGLAFRQLSYKKAFWIMGFTIFGIAATSLLINIKGCSKMLWGEDEIKFGHKGALSLPEPDNQDSPRDVDKRQSDSEEEARA
jgi:MFS transporter, NNP family, nitrate/nitrite transporter